jgi:hypothetical protein
MPKSGALETGVLNLVLNATGIANIADNTATSPLTNLYFALHTASPGASGNQSANEISYTGYSRVAVLRNTGSPAWTLTGTNPVSASPNSNVTFGTSTGGTGGTITYFSLGSLASGAGVIYYYGTVTPNITVTTGVAPQLTTASTITET